MKPSSSTQRRSSLIEAVRSALGDWGSMQTPTNVSGNIATTRAIRLLQWNAHSSEIAWSPTWCAMADARGEKIVRSAPRSLMSFNWFCSIVSRISSSEISG